MSIVKLLFFVYFYGFFYIIAIKQKAAGKTVQEGDGV